MGIGGLIGFGFLIVCYYLRRGFRSLVLNWVCTGLPRLVDGCLLDWLVDVLFGVLDSIVFFGVFVWLRFVCCVV